MRKGTGYREERGRNERRLCKSEGEGRRGMELRRRREMEARGEGGKSEPGEGRRGVELRKRWKVGTEGKGRQGEAARDVFTVHSLRVVSVFTVYFMPSPSVTFSSLV